MSMADPILLGVDTGGTFTDFLVLQDGRLRVHKCLSTPTAPEQAILQGIAELGLAPERLRVVHGSTVATNAVLEGRLARTAYVTNRGFADVLTIGRQTRAALYDLQPPPVPPPVPPTLCLEVDGRLGPGGERLAPLTEAALAELVAQLRALAPEAVAINLLFSPLDDADERRIAAMVPAGIFVSRSSAVLPTLGEYERGIATWLNAAVGPRVAGYLARLGQALAPAPVSVMQSSGQTIDSRQAGGRGVHLLLSGPAGGLAGAQAIGRACGLSRLLTFDMGGTSTDVSVIDGQPRLAEQTHVGRYPVNVPAVDVHTIGAGGGSLARVDAGGVLLVGPASAGAEPGPACYGRGGRMATVTDANVVLGRLPITAALGDLRLDRAAAEAALARVAGPLGTSPAAAAEGIIALANAHMTEALQVITLQRGEDPRDYVLACFGGAGGLHVCALAEALGITRALVPMHAGVLSAYGMLAAAPGRQAVHALGVPLCAGGLASAAGLGEALTQQIEVALDREGVASGRQRQCYVELRYRGQSHTLGVPLSGLAEAEAAFHAAHERRYGHRLDLPLEIAAVRAAVQGPAPRLPAPLRRPAARAAPADNVVVVGELRPVPVWSRAALPAAPLAGPLIVLDADSSTWVARGWQARLDELGHLHLHRQGAPSGA